MQSVKGGYESDETKRMLEQVSITKKTICPHNHHHELFLGQNNLTNSSAPCATTFRCQLSSDFMVLGIDTEVHNVCYLEKRPSNKTSGINDIADSVSQSERVDNEQGENLDEYNTETSLSTCEVYLDQKIFQIPILEAMFLMSSMSRIGKSIGNIKDMFGG